MPERVIRHGLLEPERWHFDGLPGAEPAAVLPDGPVAVSLPRWQVERGALLARGTPVGVWLAAGEDPAALEGDLPSLALVAVHFPKFTDGRGYSTAVLLRTRHGFRGELRAIGDVGRDQLFYLKRCGFDSFALPAHHDAEAALGGLHVFSVRYQGSVDDPRPLFRRTAGRRAA